MHAVAPTLPVVTANSYSSAFVEKGKVIGKVVGIALPILAAAGAAYIAPWTYLLGTIGISCLSVKLVQEALSGKIENAEKVTRMLQAALLIAGITFVGLTIGWTAISATWLYHSFSAATYAQGLLQMSFAASVGTGLVGWTGGVGRSFLESGFNISKEKIQAYFEAFNEDTELEKVKGVYQSCWALIAIVFRNIPERVLRLAPESVSHLHASLATEEELTRITQQHIQEIGTLCSIYTARRWTEGEKSQIALRVAKEFMALDLALDYCSDEVCKERMKELLDRWDNLQSIPSNKGILDGIRSDYNDSLQTIASEYLGKNEKQPNDKLTTFNEQISTIETALAGEEPNLKELIKTLCGLQKDLRDFKLAHNRANIIVGDIEDFDRWREEIKKLYKITVELHEKLTTRQTLANKDREAEIDLEDSVWNLLVTNAQTLDKADEVIKALQQKLGVVSLDQMDAKLTEIGLGSVQALFDKGIVTTKDEFLNSPDVVKERVFAFIESAKELDFRSRIYRTLSAAVGTPKISNIHRQASHVLYRLAMAVSVIAPLVVCPQAALIGGAIGIIGLGTYSLATKKIVTLRSIRDLRTFMNANSNRYDRNVSAMSSVLYFTGRRTVWGADPDSQRDLQSFTQADFFGQMRLISMEFGMTALASWTINLREVYSVLYPFIGGIMLSREGIELLPIPRR